MELICIFLISMAQAHKDGTLSEDKRKALEEIGFDWTFKRARKVSQKKTKTVWESRFSELVKVSDGVACQFLFFGSLLAKGITACRSTSRSMEPLTYPAHRRRTSW